jgi:hypothetical protein
VIDYEMVVLDPEQFIYQHGTDVNVLFERRAAVANTQSQHRSRKKWWITPASGARVTTVVTHNSVRTASMPILRPEIKSEHPKCS